MRISKLLGLAQSDSVDDGGVVQSVGEHSIFRSEHRLKQTGVGIEAGYIEYCVLSSMEFSQTSLQFLCVARAKAILCHIWKGFSIKIIILSRSSLNLMSLSTVKTI